MAINHQIKPINALPEEGLIRLKQLLQIIPVGRTSWHEGVKRGYFHSLSGWALAPWRGGWTTSAP